MIGYFIALFAISVKLTLFTLLIIPISAIGIAIGYKKITKGSTRYAILYWPITYHH